MTSEPMIRLEGLTKSFGDVAAVRDVSLLVNDGEFLTLLGPSGSGKTTVLRIIAGFEKPDGGKVFLGGKDVTDLPPYERDVNTVFQDYALFPHMSVLENVEYGLRIKKVDKKGRTKKAQEVLTQVQMAGFGDRKPSQLSGGQRQRVALARALVNQPRVLLLDEPLGALDLKLREQMQIELKQLQREVGITFIFVTHDQEEALTMSDRIAVFNEGKIVQLDSPRSVYLNPANKFVAEFVGQTNKVSADMSEKLALGGSEFTLRPEDISISKGEKLGDRAITAQIHDIIFVGATTRYLASTAAGTLVSTRPVDGESLAVGDSVTLSWSSSKEHRTA